MNYMKVGISKNITGVGGVRKTGLNSMKDCRNMMSGKLKYQMYDTYEIGNELLLQPKTLDRMVSISAANRSIGSTTGCTITEKAPKTLLRHYAEHVLTPR